MVPGTRYRGGICGLLPCHRPLNVICRIKGFVILMSLLDNFDKTQRFIHLLICKALAMFWSVPQGFVFGKNDVPGTFGHALIAHFS